MSTEVLSRWRAALNTRLMDDAERANTLAGIAKMAPQSALIQIPAVAASYAALQTKGGKLTGDSAAAAANEKAYHASVGVAAASRLAFDLELHTLKTLVQNNAASGNDVTSMGFNLLSPATLSHAPPEPPASLLVFTGKKQGKARVVVAGKGYLGMFAAQVSVDPIGPSTWQTLPGNGKQRKLAGYASGTRLWVRFAAVHLGMQSDWSTAVLVTIS